MAKKDLLKEDWKEHYNTEIQGERDSGFFACTENKEVNDLKRKIKDSYPDISDEIILKAIQLCCQELRSPYPRQGFIECVGRRLGISTLLQSANPSHLT
jgi:hypothetical protein